MATFLMLNFYEKEQTQLINNTVSRARTIIAAVDREFASTQLALRALGTSRMLQDGDLKGFHQRATDLLVYVRADSILLMDRQGALQMSTRRPYGQPLAKLASTPLLARILASGQPGVSDLFTGPLNGKLIYTIGVPVRRDDEIVMTLNATATPAQLLHVLEEQKLPGSWRASVLDSGGQVVTRSHDIAQYAGKRVSAELIRRFNSADEGSFESVTLDGIPVLVVYSRSSNSRWTAVLGIPINELNAGLRGTLIWLIAATVAALALGLAFAWLIGGRIAGSVQALVGPALALGNGADAAIPLLHFKEANQLGLALQNAAASVRRAQAETRESEQRLALAANAAHLGIWIRDLKRGTIWISDSWRKLFDFGEEQNVTQADLLQRVHPDDRAAVQRTLDNALRGVPRYDMEYRIELPDGELRWIGSQGSVETDADGQPSLVRGVSLDITKRKRAELDAQQKQKEVTHLARVAVLGELSGALAHELNQPLTAILSNAQAAQRFMARQPPNLDEVNEILQDIVDEDKRAGDTIQRLRRLFDKKEAPRQPVDLNQLALDVIRLLRNDLINHGCAVRAELMPGPALVSADRVQLQQVLINLLLNACDATTSTDGADGVIVVRIAPAGTDAIELSIIDSGSGIADAVLAKIFDPFYTTKERGMGLGLSICRNIIAAHDGQLWAENNAQQGATFHIRLPLAADPQP